MDITPEINLTKLDHKAIKELRNQSFPEHQADRSYFKQLPHMRALEYQSDKLVAHMGLDYRVVGVANDAYKVLGIIDFCVDKAFQGQGIGSSMLSQISEYAKKKDVDFIILISELHDFYTANGYQRINATNSWLRLHEHRNYGVAIDQIDDLYIKPISGKSWAVGHVDWLGYMY
jgi:predicted N-acetyltransferase YhbS